MNGGIDGEGRTENGKAHHKNDVGSNGGVCGECEDDEDRHERQQGGPQTSGGDFGGQTIRAPADDGRGRGLCEAVEDRPKRHEAADHG